MKNNFDLKQYLTENKLTYNSSLNEEDATLDNLSDKLEKGKSFTLDIDLDDEIEKVMNEINEGEVNEMANFANATDKQKEELQDKLKSGEYKGKEAEVAQGIIDSPIPITKNQIQDKFGGKVASHKAAFDKVLSDIGIPTINTDEFKALQQGKPVTGKIKPKKQTKLSNSKKKINKSGDNKEKVDNKNDIGGIGNKEGAWWSYLAEYFAGLYLLKRIKKDPNLVYVDTENELKDGYKKRISTPNGEKYWNSKDEKSELRKKRMLRASSEMAKVMYDKLLGEENIHNYQLKIYASGEGTGGQDEKADLKIDFIPLDDMNLDPKTIGVSIKTSLNNNTDITSQPQVGRILRFISLGSENKNGKNVTPEELKKDFENAGLYKYAIKDTIDFLINWKNTLLQFKDVAKKLGINPGSSNYRTQLQWIIPQIIKKIPYEKIPEQIKKKINQEFYEDLLNNHSDELIKSYKDLYSIHSTADNNAKAIAQAFTRGILQSYKSADKTDEDWKNWKKMWLNWLGFGNGEWIIKSWYPDSDNLPKVSDVLNDPNIGPKVKQFQEDFYNDKTRLDVVYDWDKDKKTGKWKINLVDNETNRTYVAFDAHIINTSSFQMTLDLDKLDNLIGK